MIAEQRPRFVKRPHTDLDEVGRVERHRERGRSHRVHEVATAKGVIAVDVALVLVHENEIVRRGLARKSRHASKDLVSEIGEAAVRDEEGEDANALGAQALGRVDGGSQAGELGFEVILDRGLADWRTDRRDNDARCSKQACGTVEALGSELDDVDAPRRAQFECIDSVALQHGDLHLQVGGDLVAECADRPAVSQAILRSRQGVLWHPRAAWRAPGRCPSASRSRATRAGRRPASP